MGVLPSAGWSGKAVLGGDRGGALLLSLIIRTIHSLYPSGSSGLCCIHISLWNPFACTEEGRKEGSSSSLFSMSPQSSERLPHLVPGSIQSQCRLFTPYTGLSFAIHQKAKQRAKQNYLFLRATVEQSCSSLALRE